MSNMNKDAPGSRPEGAEAQAGAFDSTGRTHIRRIYEKAEAHSKLERICLIDRHRHYPPGEECKAPEHDCFRAAAGGHNPNSREKGQKSA